MLAAQVMADPALKGNFLKCTPSGDGTACLHDTIIEFGRRAAHAMLESDQPSAFVCCSDTIAMGICNSHAA